MRFGDPLLLFVPLNGAEGRLKHAGLTTGQNNLVSGATLAVNNTLVSVLETLMI